jgi:hypothetical protein
LLPLDPACTRDLVPSLVSCCATLEVLHCHWGVFSALPAACPAFPRLTELELDGQKANLGATSPAWDTTANSGLPALGTLSVWGVKGLLWGRSWAGWGVPWRRWRARLGG